MTNINAVKRINTVYMKVVRRIAGAVRFKLTDNITNLDARRAINAPSIECLLLRARLLYFSSLARFGPPILLAIFASITDSQREPGGTRRMTWAAQIIHDLRAINEYYRTELRGTPDPTSGPAD